MNQRLLAKPSIFSLREMDETRIRPQSRWFVQFKTLLGIGRAIAAARWLVAV
jgi:hypothetical protein